MVEPTMYQVWPETSETRQSNIVSSIAKLSQTPWIESLDWPLPFWVSDNLHDIDLPSGCTFWKADDTWILETEGSYENILKNKYNQSTRRKVRIANKKAIEIIDLPSPDELQEFTFLWSSLYYSRGFSGKYLTKDFFLALPHYLGASAKVILARTENRIVAGGVFLEEEDGYVYYCGAMDRKYTSQFPMYAVFDYMVKSICDSKKSYLNFGGTGGRGNLAEFKRQWGANPKPIYWLRCSKSDKIQLNGVCKKVNAIITRLISLYLFEFNTRRQISRGT